MLTLEGERSSDYVEHARVGAREGLLPWSRERQVGRLLIEAERLAADGDEQRALLKIERDIARAVEKGRSEWEHSLPLFRVATYGLGGVSSLIARFSASDSLEASPPARANSSAHNADRTS